MAERKMADALDELYDDGVKKEIQNCKNDLKTEFDSKLENKVDKGANDFAPLDSPNFTGTPTAPNPDINDDSQQLATTAHCAELIRRLVGTAPAVLDTLAELATAINNDPNFRDTILNLLAQKLSITDAANTYLQKNNPAVNNGITFYNGSTVAAQLTVSENSVVFAKSGSGATSQLILGANDADLNGGMYHPPGDTGYRRCGIICADDGNVILHGGALYFWNGKGGYQDYGSNMTKLA